MVRIQKVGIIGEGKMGGGIFSYLIDYPFELVWVCSPGADTDKLSRQFARRIKRSLDTGIIDQQQFDKMAQTKISSDLAGLHDCDLVIEAVSEILELKRDIFLRLDKIVKPEAAFASNSSSINPSEMTPAGPRAEKFVGVHFFYPVPMKDIVEFTITSRTADQTVNMVESFLHDIHRRFITLDEKNSFMLNKIFLDFQNEAFLIVRSGKCTVNQMDMLVKKHLFPFGVFDFCDSVGLDTMLSSIVNYTRDYPHKTYYSQLIAALSGLIAAGKLGMKTQEGFYRYPPEETPCEEPANAKEIINHLYQTWLSSSKRFTALAHIPIDDANSAIREYFDISKGPFE
jgi:3-hydroxybutyryl-CoA dehydrogenase